jgi:hypothetical protein
METEPVEVVPVVDTAQLRQAFGRCFARGNPPKRMPRTRADWPPPLLPKYAHVKSRSAFERGLSTWDINDGKGAWEIHGHRKGRFGRGTERDPEQRTALPPGTPIEQVIERMIAILQSAAKG